MYIYENFTQEEIENYWYTSLTKKEFMQKLGYKRSDTTSIQKKFNLSNEDLGKDNSNKKNYMIGPKGAKIEDLTGKIFGHWHVLALDEEKTKNDFKHSWWICQCDCEKKTIKSITMNNLKRRKTQSCGCTLIRAEDMIGKRYGKLKVLNIEENIQNRRGKMVRCRCDCGNEKIVCCTDLKDGKIGSCGCSNSIGESKINAILIENNMNYKRQYSFPDLKGDKNVLLFDFAIFDKENNLKYLIEYQGIQHYQIIEYFGGEEGFKKRQEYDNKKIKYCELHKIPLIILNENNKLIKEEIIKEELLYE